MSIRLDDHVEAAPLVRRTDLNVRPATMTDVLELVARSRHAFHVVRLPETIILAANAAAAELYGQSSDAIIGRTASTLFRGADEVHAAVALSALAAGAIDSYSVQCRSAITSGVDPWLCVRRLEVEDARVAVMLTVPAEQQRPLDAIEEELATARGIVWVRASPWRGTTLADRSGSVRVSDHAFEVLDRLSARQREIVAALLRGERIAAIAASQFVSRSTVRSHLSVIFRSFGVHSQPELLTLLHSQQAAAGRDSRRPQAEETGDERTQMTRVLG
jgi:DNA-binding CsgD family transcriptional regulator